ncbi:MAG TPA: hypothetical protein VHI53_14220 [Gaiellaceae bacterium]|nr:hypothetical protein [Gaiellaceae bacterium]
MQRTTTALARGEKRVEALRQEQQEAMFDAYYAGETLGLIAQQAGVSPQRVHQIVHAIGSEVVLREQGAEAAQQRARRGKQESGE